MALPLKESQASANMARILYRFLPGSGFRKWKGHVSFSSIAQSLGIGNFWNPGSKEPAIATLLEKTLEYKRSLFEPLLLTIVREGIKYCQKQGQPITADEIEQLNGLILEIGFKFPQLWDPDFLSSLRFTSQERARMHLEREIRAEQMKADKQSEYEQEMEKLKTQFYELHKLNDRQAAGLSLERLLNRLFELENLAPRNPFRVTGEQIDGSFALDNEIYLVEAKWLKDPIPEAPLLVFRGKVESRSNITRGVFISLSRCTTDALDAISRGKQPNFFVVDGYDLTLVLERRIDLKEMLRVKLRRLAEEGLVFVSARDLF